MQVIVYNKTVTELDISIWAELWYVHNEYLKFWNEIL